MSKHLKKTPPHLKLQRAKHGKIHSDIAQLKKKTDKQIAHAVKSDSDAARVSTRWPKDTQVHPAPKKVPVSLRIDPETLDFFKGQGPGHLTRMNAVLRAYAKVHQ